MLFKVLKPTYINDSLKDVGEQIDYPVEKMAKNPDGTVNMAKHSSLEPLEEFPEPVRLVPLTPAGSGKSGQSDADLEKQIVGAINGLDAFNDDHWTEGGKPRLEALELALGFKVTRQQVETLAPNARREKPAG